MPKTCKILDLSGYMFSGKSALSDLLREFSGIHVPNYRVEFDLLRVSGGLIDLHNAVIDWSPIRTHSALNQFEQVARGMASRPTFPMNLFFTGNGYEEIYPNLLDSLDSFLTEAVVVSWQTPWPYDDLDDGLWATFSRKLLNKFGVNRMRAYRLTSPDVFISAAQRFIRNILTEGIEYRDGEIIVTHNALEPFNPALHLNLLGDDARCITVDRDPRDIYATAITTQQGFNDNLEFYKSIAGAHSIETFLKRQTLYRAMTDTTSENVLRIKFEDLVDRYERTLYQVCDFLRLDVRNHQHRYKYFIPERSAKNVGLWKKKELADYSGDFERIAHEYGLSNE